MSVDSAFAAAIRDAFDRPGSDAIVQAVKDVVSRRFEQTDKSVRISHTAYFNHTVAPDLLLSWPRENRTRQVFLRTNPDLVWMADDLSWVSKSRPILLSLAAAPPAPAQDSVKLREAASASDTLVTNPEALDEVDSTRATEPAVAILAQALLQGGRGLVEEPEAREAARITADGFDGAQRLDDKITATATGLLDTLLDDAMSGRMTRMLQAVWEGHGGTLTAFPAQGHLGGALRDEDLIFLLDTLTTDDWAFWRRIGASVSTAQLARLALPEPSPNFQSLVRASLPQLMAKALRVRGDLADGLDPDAPSWAASHGCLALRGDGWTAYLAPTRTEELPSAEEHDGIAIGELRARTTPRNLSVGNVQLRRADRAITYESTEEADVVNDDELSQLASSAKGAASRVTKATITLPAGRRLTCDFKTGSGTGHTTAVFPVSELVRIGVPLLMKLSDEEVMAIEGALNTPLAAGDQDMLNF